MAMVAVPVDVQARDDNAARQQLMQVQSARSDAEARAQLHALDAKKHREVFVLLEAECRDLRRQLAQKPLAEPRHGGGYPTPERAHSDVAELTQQVQELTAELSSRPMQKDIEAMQWEVHELRAELSRRPQAEEVQGRLAAMQAQLDLRPTMRDHENFQQELCRIRTQLSAAPTPEAHGAALREARALAQRAEDAERCLSQETTELRRAQEREAALRSELQEAGRQREQLQRRNAQLTSDLATVKAQAAVDGAKFMKTLSCGRSRVQTEDSVTPKDSLRSDVTAWKSAPFSSPHLSPRLWPSGGGVGDAGCLSPRSFAAAKPASAAVDGAPYAARRASTGAVLVSSAGYLNAQGGADSAYMMSPRSPTLSGRAVAAFQPPWAPLQAAK